MSFQMSKEEQLNDFDSVVNAFIIIGNKLEGGKIPNGLDNLNDAEGIGKKILNHAITARILCSAYQYKNFDPVIDFSSIAVLARSVFESYLVFNFLFISPRDDDEKEFKIQAWTLGGLDRVKHRPSYGTNITKYSEEIRRKDEIIAKIESTNFFKSLNEKRKKEVLKGKWQIEGWFQMAKDAGFSESFFRRQYMFFSSYVHSNRLSIIQIQQLRNPLDQVGMAIVSISIISTVIAKFTYDYVQLIPTLKEIINFRSEEFKIIIQYKEIAELLI